MSYDWHELTLTFMCSGIWKVPQKIVDQFLVKPKVFGTDPPGFGLLNVHEGSFIGGF